jgi:alpha-L-arabinofuranosidase
VKAQAALLLVLATALVQLPCGNVHGDEPAKSQTTVIEVDPAKTLHRLSRHLTGACIEDVNHEIYGGIYSQMVFGESFQEPAGFPGAIEGFRALGGDWQVRNGELRFSGELGCKLISELPTFDKGEVGLEVFAERNGANLGLIVCVGNAARGADNFDGFEISLRPERQDVFLGRHQQDFRPIAEAPCKIPIGEWVSLVAKVKPGTIEVLVNGESVMTRELGRDALPQGTFGIRQWQREARYRNLWIKTGDAAKTEVAFKGPAEDQSVSGMWKPVQTGSAKGTYSLVTEQPFVGRQSQQITFAEGSGAIAVANEGLNQWGMRFASDGPYEGVIYAKSDKTTKLYVALEGPNGSPRLAETELTIKAGTWRQLEFKLSPGETVSRGRLIVGLKSPGSVTLGYVSLQPGDWGRFRGLPVRKDVASGLVDQGVTFLRYGGSMVNNPEYRWLKMIGPRESRPPYAGHWYPYSTNGWGIVDFLVFSEAAGFEYIPTFNMDERPEDMAAFIQYCKGDAKSEWGEKRVVDGHPEPFALRYIQLGNEERIDGEYVRKFRGLAEAIWKLDPKITIVCGDFMYGEVIRDPMQFRGNPSGITTLAAHKEILALAKKHDREVWFDVHVWTEGPRLDSTTPATLSFVDALEKIADGAKHRVVVYELNSNNHEMRRGVANALAINALARDGRIPFISSANALQPDGQNDNGWNQGLLFLNQSQVWLQPPGYVTQMYARNYQPIAIQCDSQGPDSQLDVMATKSEDGAAVVLRVVNPTDQPALATIRIKDFAPKQTAAKIVELSGSANARNTADQPRAVVPVEKEWEHDLKSGKAEREFPPFSVTIISLR